MDYTCFDKHGKIHRVSGIVPVLLVSTKKNGVCVKYFSRLFTGKKREGALSFMYAYQGEYIKKKAFLWRKLYQKYTN